MMKVNAASLFAGALLGSDPLAGSGDQSGEVALFRKLFQRFAQMGDGAKQPATTGQPAADTSKFCSPLAATILSDPALAESLPATETSGEIASPFPAINTGASFEASSGPFPQLEATVDTALPTQASQPLPALKQGQAAPQNPFLAGVSISTQPATKERSSLPESAQQEVANQGLASAEAATPPLGNVEPAQPTGDCVEPQSELPLEAKHLPQNSQARPRLHQSKTPAAPEPASRENPLQEQQKPAQHHPLFARKSSPAPSAPAEAISAQPGTQESIEKPADSGDELVENNPILPALAAMTQPAPLLKAVAETIARLSGSESASAEPAPTSAPFSGPITPEGDLRSTPQTGQAASLDDTESAIELSPETTAPQPPRPGLMNPSRKLPAKVVSSDRASIEPSHSAPEVDSPQAPKVAPGSSVDTRKAAPKPASSPAHATRVQHSNAISHKATGTAVEPHPESTQAVQQESPKVSSFTVVSPQKPAQPSVLRTQAMQKSGATRANESEATPVDYGTSPPPTPPSLEGTAWAKARANRSPHLSVVGKSSADSGHQQALTSSSEQSGPQPEPRSQRRVVHLTLVTPFPGQKSSAPAGTFQAAWPKLPENFSRIASAATVANDSVSSPTPQAPAFTAKVISLELPGKPAAASALQPNTNSQSQPVLGLRQAPASADFTRHLVSYSPAAGQTQDTGLAVSSSQSENNAVPSLASHLAKASAQPTSEPPSGFPIKQPATLESIKTNLSATLANTQPIQINPSLAQPRTPVTQSFNVLALEAGQQQAQPTARFQPIKVITGMASATMGTATVSVDSSAAAISGMDTLPTASTGGQANLTAANIFEKPVTPAGADTLITPLFKQKSDGLPIAPASDPLSEASAEDQGPVFRVSTEKTPSGTALNMAAVSGSHFPTVEKLDKMGVESVSRLLEHRLTKADQPARQKLELELDPERLGALKIEISVDPVSKKVETHLIVSHESAREALEHQFPLLRQRLSEHGIHMESRFSMASENGNSADTHGGGRNHQSQKRSTLAGDLPTESEGSSAAQANGNLYA